MVHGLRGAYSLTQLLLSLLLLEVMNMIAPPHAPSTLLVVAGKFGAANRTSFLNDVETTSQPPGTGPPSGCWLQICCHKSGTTSPLLSKLLDYLPPRINRTLVDLVSGFLSYNDPSNHLESFLVQIAVLNYLPIGRGRSCRAKANTQD
ncbi:hypothetical protein HCBG_09000 [Histoplasma capsulatum G186AR]|uniref:Uncharacterized protein n=1 Tax=Ajellomyces capsulatus (strain G186AR / H82 / ATCC MYA-2454 / RMSCC 2432) TaxID=447093 RepID=C0P0S0_AJECG|nr:uncharacterized protein HCBG_09000 [Histoplasma capsulatum G186AR]EEH02720.1 hypothetical protein HCBG_09000 [Histoplasma capsulatum G186AR]